ncbi:3-keto-disaccharide hydrolase [Planctomycetaceae bacterium SH139]
MRAAVLMFRSFCFGVALVGAASAHGQDPPAKIALTEPPENDPSYALQGEFVGPIKSAEGENQYVPLALQLRCVGGENFEAVTFMGGLPGQANHQPGPTKLLGRRAGDFLVLSGGPWAIIVEQNGCQIIARNGERLGRLERVERVSPTLGAASPDGAIVLFDGSGTEQFTSGEMTEDGLLTQGSTLKPMLQDFNLHVEFRLPYMPLSAGQSRGNSGIYLMSRYECQILDSFAQDIVFNGCGALYRFKAPDINMCLPPLVWQTYDVQFTAPRWAADGSKLRDAHVTSWLNGVKVHDNVSIPGPTGAGKAEEPNLLPTFLQNHSDPVRFRNVWVVDRGLMTTSEFPVLETAVAPVTPEDEKAVEPTGDAGVEAEAESPAPANAPAAQPAEPTAVEPSEGEK